MTYILTQQPTYLELFLYQLRWLAQRFSQKLHHLTVVHMHTALDCHHPLKLTHLEVLQLQWLDQC